MLTEATSISLGFTDRGDGMGRIVLATHCDACMGTGIAYNPAWEPFNARMRDWLATDMSGLAPEPEEGIGSEEIPCPKCDGTTYIVTEAGRALLRFISSIKHD